MYHELRKRGTRRHVIPDPPLLVVTDRRQARRPLSESLDDAFAAGCRWASLREKDLAPAEQIALARALREIAERHGARLMLHGEPATAAAAGLSGIHLAAGSDAAAARALLGPRALIGISIHSVVEARALDPDLVDYAVAGPAFETASKPGYGPALGPAGIRAIVEASRVPILAIGGIEAARIEDMTCAGAAGVAVMGSAMRDPAGTMTTLLRSLAVHRARYGATP